MLIPMSTGLVQGGAGGWDISTASYVQAFDVSSQTTVPAGLFFRDNGQRMFVCDFTNSNLIEYDLSTAWDISSAVFSDARSVSAKETSPWDIYFKPDGTAFFLIGQSSDSVHHYNLSAAWDVSSLSFVRSLSVASQDTFPRGVFFSANGERMFALGAFSNSVFEYELSTAWDISTATFNDSFSVASQDTAPRGLFFKDDGTRMYVVGNDGDDINEYSLSAWDVSTASFTQSFSVSSQDAAPTGVFIGKSGLKMYVAGNDNDSIYEYDLG